MVNHTTVGNGPSIVVSVFEAVLHETEFLFGSINRETARSLLFMVMNDTTGAQFHIAVSKAKSALYIAEGDRTKYHSLAVKYFTRLKNNRRQRKTEKRPARRDPWAEIRTLCQAEARSMAMARNEHIIGPNGTDRDFSPPYKGPPKWDV